MSTSHEPGDPAIVAARSAIEATDLADPATLSDLDAIRFTDAGAAAAEQAITAGATGDALWAATWIYGTSGADPAVLAPLLDNPDPTIRAMAGAAALSLGAPAAAGVLADLMAEDGNLRGSEPPLAIFDFAAGSLARYVDGPPIPDGAGRRVVALTWRTWLAANSTLMRFDAATGRWSAR